MSRPGAAPAVLGAAITGAVALWWLPGAWLQARGGFAGLPALGAQAAFCLVLAQGALVCLFAPRWFAPSTVGAWIPHDASRRDGASRGKRVPTVRCAAGALLAIAPAWPLLALLWLTSELSALVLVVTQLLLALAAVLLALTGGALARTSFGEPARGVLRGAAGIAAAIAVWSLRDGLYTWMVPA